MRRCGQTFGLVLLSLASLPHLLCAQFTFEDLERIVPSYDQAQQISAISPSSLTDPLSTQNRNVLPQNNYETQFDERVCDAIAENVLRFAHNVGQQLSDAAPYSKSIVLSPASVMSALALLLLGAKGKSYQQLQDVLGLYYGSELSQKPTEFHTEFGAIIEDLQRHDESELLRPRKNSPWRQTTVRGNIRNTPARSQNVKPVEHIIKVANGIFSQIDYSLNPDYRYIIKSVYRAELAQLDFARDPSTARDHINDWVGRSTFGKIPQIINSDIPYGTNVIIASALYFKGFWENTFFEAATITDKFYPDGEGASPVKVKMMATGGVFPFYDAPEYNCRIIGLPYKGNLTTMYVIQPYQSSRAKLRELQKFLDAPKIEDLISKMTRKSAVLAFPKMHIRRSLNMRDLLINMGVRDIFTGGLSDLSLIGGAYSRRRPTPASSLQFAHAQSVRPVPPKDRFNEQGLIFTRFGEVPNQNETDTESTIKGFTTDTVSDGPETTKVARGKRQAPVTPLLDRYSAKQMALQRLENERSTPRYGNSNLFVEDILHKVDIEVNEQGTEAAAATLTYLRRSGTDVLFRAETPFMFLIRHDPTKMVLFYGIVNEPEL